VGEFYFGELATADGDGLTSSTPPGSCFEREGKQPTIQCLYLRNFVSSQRCFGVSIQCFTYPKCFRMVSSDLGHGGSLKITILLVRTKLLVES
jgi:hypothetical protein